MYKRCEIIRSFVVPLDALELVLWLLSNHPETLQHHPSLRSVNHHPRSTETSPAETKVGTQIFQLIHGNPSVIVVRLVRFRTLNYVCSWIDGSILYIFIFC